MKLFRYLVSFVVNFLRLTFKSPVSYFIRVFERRDFKVSQVICPLFGKLITITYNVSKNETRLPISFLYLCLDGHFYEKEWFEGDYQKLCFSLIALQVLLDVGCDFIGSHPVLSILLKGGVKKYIFTEKNIWSF